MEAPETERNAKVTFVMNPPFLISIHFSQRTLLGASGVSNFNQRTLLSLSSYLNCNVPLLGWELLYSLTKWVCNKLLHVVRFSSAFYNNNQNNNQMIFQIYHIIEDGTFT